MNIKGIIIKSNGTLDILGFYTANIKLDKMPPFLKEGVYAAWAQIENATYATVFAAEIKKERLQIYLIDTDLKKNIGKQIKLNVIQQISQMEVCKTKKELKNKILKDINVSKKILNDHKKRSNFSLQNTKKM